MMSLGAIDGDKIDGCKVGIVLYIDTLGDMERGIVPGSSDIVPLGV